MSEQLGEGAGETVHDGPDGARPDEEGTQETTLPPDARVPTGIDGLDEILHGGLMPGGGYLVRGAPGSGKTIVGMHFLREGLDRGETPLLISLEETEEDLKANAARLRLDIDPVQTLDLSMGLGLTGPDDAEDPGVYDVFSPDQVEGESIIDAIMDRIDEVDPDRVFLDPISLLRHLTPDAYQFRRQVILMTRTLRDRGATLVMTSQATTPEDDADLQFVTDGTIEMGYRGPFRAVSVPKFRGSPTRGGDHTFRIGDGGITVFPSLEIPKRPPAPVSETISSGIPALDELLHGGLERGTTTVISGPTGAGKTTLGTQFMKEAAGRGERSVVYLFEESMETFRARSRALNIPVKEMVERGTLGIETVQALERSPEELGQMVRADVEGDGARIVMLDGLAGMRMSTRGDILELRQKVHALTHYLQAHNVTAILIDEVQEIQAGFRATNYNISYLADNIIVLRHIELEGQFRKVIGVLKKRISDYQRQLRELEITERGLKVSEPLTGLRGILSGTPEMLEREPRGERGQRGRDGGDQGR